MSDEEGHEVAPVDSPRFSDRDGRTEKTSTAPKARSALGWDEPAPDVVRLYSMGVPNGHQGREGQLLSSVRGNDGVVHSSYYKREGDTVTDWFDVTEHVLVAYLGDDYYKHGATQEDVYEAAEMAENEGLLEQATWWSVVTMLNDPGRVAADVLAGNTVAGSLINAIWNDEWSVMVGAWLDHYEAADADLTS